MGELSNSHFACVFQDFNYFENRCLGLWIKFDIMYIWFGIYYSPKKFIDLFYRPHFYRPICFFKPKYLSLLSPRYKTSYVTSLLIEPLMSHCPYVHTYIPCSPLHPNLSTSCKPHVNHYLPIYTRPLPFVQT